MHIKKIILFYISILIHANAIPIYNPMDITVRPMDITVYPVDVVIYPMDEDEDGDGILNNKDTFPTNPNEWQDTDHDGIGNNADKDDDGDGMSDAIERKYHFNPLNAADASADKDGDGFSNATEVGLGYNPLSSASHPIWVPLIMGDIMAFVPARH